MEKDVIVRNRFVKLIVGLVLGLAIALLLAFNALMLWVATGPRSLNALSPYIAAAFAPPGGAYSVAIGETWLIWDGWEHPIDIRLRNVAVLTRDGQRFSSFSEISVGLDVLSLPSGQLLPTSLTITRPSIHLFQNDDRSISFGFRQEQPAPGEAAAAAASEEVPDVPFAAVIAPLISPDNAGSLRKMRLIEIVGADISVGNKHKGVFFKALDADILLKRDRQGALQASASAKIAYDQYQSQVRARMVIAKSQPKIDGEIAFNQLMPGTLAALFSDNKALAAMQLPVSGSGKWRMDKDGTLERMNFTIDGGKGTIVSDKLAGLLPVNALHAEGQISNNAADIQIDTFTAESDKMEIAGKGVASFSNGDVALRGDALLKNVPAARLPLLWPPALSPESRNWVLNNVKEGRIPQAQAHFDIAFGDLAKPALPKSAIDATLELEGAKIRYLPEHPEVRNVRGRIHIDGASLQAEIESGEYLKETKLSAGRLLIEDLNADNPYIKLSFTADAPASDMVHVLGLPRLKHAARLNLSEDTVSGSVKGSGALGFYFFAARNEDVAYDITAELKDVGQPRFMNKFDIANANGSLTVKNSGLEFKGKGDVNGAKASAAVVKYLFHPEKGFDTFIDVTASAPVDVLPRFGYPAFPFLKGTLGVKAVLKQGSAEEMDDISIDLAHASVAMPSIALIKPDQQPATFAIAAEKKEGRVTITSFHLTGPDMEAEGSAELSKDLSEFTRIQASKTRYGNVNLDSFLYELIPGGYRLEAKGASADASGWADDEGKNSFSFAHFPALQLKADLGRLMLGNGREFTSVKGMMTCDTAICGSANITGATVDGKPFALRILNNPAGVRQFSLHAQSAGAFLRAANIFDGMEGGDLTITGSFDDRGVLKGRMDIDKHIIKDAPVLAQILSLASLTGFFDTLRGKGIAFTKFIAPFTRAQDVITIEKGKTYGAAIGITFAGSITFPRQALQLEGTVIPSYNLNNVLGNVPLVGPMLMGGEGQGVFAARYSVTGSASHPKVSVNPLSMLTPGFLRGVFDIWDTPKPPDNAE